MEYVLGDLVQLPSDGTAIVVTDLHGNLTNFRDVLNLWTDCYDRKCHLIITGDFIQAIGIEHDHSIEILDEVQYQWNKNKNFHLLLGNHEWATLTGISVYKNGINQTEHFEMLIRKIFQEQWSKKLKEYAQFFKKLPLAVRTANQVFISHAGPPHNVKSIQEIIHITKKGYLNNQMLYELLWNRSKDFNKKDLQKFLKAVDCKAMVVGHTPVKSYKQIGNQIILSASENGKRAYLLLDLEKKIKDGKDLLKMIHYF